VAREADTLACLRRGEQRMLMRLLDKMIVNGPKRAKPY